MKISNEMLSAFHDGELGAAEHEVVSVELKSSEDLRNRLAALQKAGERANEYFHEIDAVPLSNTMKTFLQDLEKNKVIPFSRKPARKMSLSQWALPLAASLALLIGFGTGQLTAPRQDGATFAALMDQTNGRIQGTNPLYAALEQGRSGVAVALSGSSTVIATPILSFRNADGDYCREFMVTGEIMASRNLACKQSGKAWTIMAMTSAPVVSEGDYVPASDAVPDAIDARIDAMIDGSALGQAEETQMILNQWGAETP